MLALEKASCAYGKIQVVWDVDLNLEAGGRVALLGKNGAGKSTLLRAISGVVPLKSGRIFFDGRDITTMSQNDRVAKGIVLVPEGRRIFQKMTVMENLKMGAYRSRDSIEQKLVSVFQLFPILGERKSQAAGTLSGGQQQMLAIARAMMASPKLLMLDEPSAGLAPVMVAKVLESLKELNAKGVTILLAEQNFFLAARFAERAYVLDNGRIRHEGSLKQLLSDESVKRAYLGISPPQLK